MSAQQQRLALPDVLARLDRLTNWEARPRIRTRDDLGPPFDLMERLGNPQRRFRAIHVTGTKGKGSVCALIEAALLRAGLRVGRYASPHVEHMTERVCLMGQSIGEAEFATALTAAMDAYEIAIQAGTSGAGASWFDIVTAAAFLIFADAGLDWAVLEVGIGGRLDSTNVADGEVAVITNVELEHTEVLGATREAIAREKAGILKTGACLVTTLSPDDPAGRVVRDMAAAQGCSVRRTPLSSLESIDAQNAEMAGLVLDDLGGRLGVVAKKGEKASVGRWLLDEATRAKARLPGRLERFTIDAPAAGASKTITIVLDGAHVPFNLEAVLRDLSSKPGLGGPCVAVVTLASDKDAEGFFAVLARHGASVILTALPDATRGRSAQELAGLARSVGLACDIEPDPHTALNNAVQTAAAVDGWVLVTGSLYLVGALRKAVMSLG
jgi:dihydrofolate synthase / folylpolyglutamate synthase